MRTGAQVSGARSTGVDPASGGDTVTHPPAEVTADRSALARLTAKVALGVALLQVVIGSVWWVLNLDDVPAYGDTPEYQDLAQALRVDQHRTLAYPLIVRAAFETAERTPLPWQVPLYLGQTLLMVCAAWYVVRSVAPAMSRARVAFATSVVATSPLVLHYAVTVLSDSIAGSLFVVALAGVARILVWGDRSPWTVVLVSASTLGASLVRSEKAVVLAAFAIAVLAVLLLVKLRRRSAGEGSSLRPVAVVLVLALVLPALLATVANRATQTADYGRPEAGLTSIGMTRIVWPHLSEIREDLPPEARARISAADAALFDSNNNNVMPMTQVMLGIDDGGHAITGAAIRAALACCAATIALDTATDAAEYAVAPLTFIVEGVPVLLPGAPEPVPGLSATVWDLTRMNMAHPSLTNAWLVVSWVLLPLLALGGLASRLRSGASATARSSRRRRDLVLLTIWLGTVLNGCIFAAVGGADANVRYAIATFMAITCALVVWALATDDDHEVQDAAVADDGDVVAGRV